MEDSNPSNLGAPLACLRRYTSLHAHSPSLSKIVHARQLGLRRGPTLGASVPSAALAADDKRIPLDLLVEMDALAPARPGVTGERTRPWSNGYGACLPSR